MGRGSASSRRGQRATPDVPLIADDSSYLEELRYHSQRRLLALGVPLSELGGVLLPPPPGYPVDPLSDLDSR